MYKRLIGAFVACLLAVLGFAGPAAATAYPDNKDKKAELEITDVKVDRHGDLDVDFEETGLDKGDEAKVFGVAKFYVKYACVKHKKWGYKVKIKHDWGRAYDFTKGEADDDGKFEGSLELNLPELECKRNADPKLLYVKWSHLFVKDKESGAHDFEYGPWVAARKKHHHGYNAA